MVPLVLRGAGDTASRGFCAGALPPAEALEPGAVALLMPAPSALSVLLALPALPALPVLLALSLSPLPALSASSAPSGRKRASSSVSRCFSACRF